MPRSYNGTPANADASGSSDWAVARSLVTDGENFNDATFVVGNLQPVYDRVAWLKLHGAWSDLPNIFTATNTFDATVNLGDGGSNTPTMFVKAGSTIQVNNSGNIELKNGGQFLGDAGCHFVLNGGSGFVIVEVDTLTLTAAGGGFSQSGPRYKGGNAAVDYIRSPNSTISATQHIDCTQDVWRISDTLSGAINVLVDAPPQTGFHTLLTVLRSPNADTHAVNIVQGTGTGGAAGNGIATFNEGGHPTVTEYDGSTSGRCNLELEWSPQLGLWRVYGVTGAVVPVIGAP